ncbi:MAG: hypothetical protein JXN65_03805 [Clostridia bacterium]|nr:hypothetical protein [Clostridia bacterium]
MKRYIFTFKIMPAIIVSLVLSACGQASSDPEVVADSNEVAKEDTMEKTEMQEEPTIDPQEAIDHEKVMKYLDVLGLDDTCAYELRDTFAVENSDNKSYLINISGVLDDDFTAIEAALAANGFNIVSDITEDEERQARSYQYSDGKSLYIEIVYSYGAEYMDVHFVPQE